MATNPFKAFIAYDTERITDYTAIEKGAVPIDPSGGQWSTTHFVEMPTGEAFSDLGNCKIGCLQFNDRMLPGRVIKEELDKRVAHLAEQQGHKVSKKDRAQMRYQVEFDLLPQAFMKRTQVYFAFVTVNRKPVLLVFTSSQKRADDVATVLNNCFDDALVPKKIEMDARVGGWLTALATGSRTGEFFADKTAVLIGEDGRRVTVKDFSVDHHSVQDLLTEGFSVTAMSMYVAIAEGHYTFTLTDKVIFKNFDIDGVKPTQMNEDFDVFAVLYITQIKAMLPSLIAEVVTGEDDEL